MSARRFIVATEGITVFPIWQEGGSVVAEAQQLADAKLLAASGDLAEVCLSALPLLRFVEQVHERTDNLPEDKALELRELIQKIGAALDLAGLVEEVPGG